MSASRYVLVFAVALAATSGCASFRRDVRDLGSWPPAPAVKPAVRVAVVMAVTVDGTSHPMSVNQAERASSHVVRVFRESGLFSNVEAAPEGSAPAPASDLAVEIRVASTTEPLFGSTVLTFFTAFAIPSAYDTHLVSTSTFRDGSGQTLAVIEESASTRTVEHVTLLPFSIFTYPIPVYWRTFDHLQRLTLESARSRGVL